MAVGEFFRRLFQPFLTKDDLRRIADAIKDVESRTTGEIVVHVIGRVGKEDILEVAKRTFEGLQLHKTRERNAVLILISDLDHRYAIYGDAGIHQKAGQELWEHAAKAMGEAFAQDRFAHGIELAVREVGLALTKVFPKAPGDDNPNELPDQPTRS